MTSRTLVIMRHAKAIRSDGLEDSERPLEPRGRADAKAAGTWYAARGFVPELVLCSPAVRTRSTWHEVAIGLAEAAAVAAPTVRYETDLYSSGLNAALDMIRGVDEGVGTILVVGHNPTVSALSSRLDERSDRAAAGLRTAGIAVHAVETPWADLTSARLTASFTPRG
jgi:phosphohistidine phosphatase